jgi:sigma-B regulation protein RsbU (phosphoserine phosphatase)
MKTNKHRWPSLQFRNSLPLLILAAVLIQATGAVQYYFARNGIRKEVEHHAKTEMTVKHLEIQQMVSGVESAVENVRWLLGYAVDNPETIYPILEQFIKSNPDIRGCAFAFVPYHFEEMGRWYEPYVMRDTNGVLIQKQIADASHDYHQMNWYKEGLVADDGRWTEPYIDNEGAHGMICTYTIPIRNEAGEPVAVFGADLSLDWLTDKFAMQEGTKEVSFLVSREGRLLACPDKDKIMKYSLEDIKAQNSAAEIETINREMLAGHEGSAKVRDNNGDKRIIYYSPVGGKTGWSMAIIFSEKEMYKELRSVSLKLQILMILGLALMIYIMWRMVRGFKRLQTVSAEKERIGSELRIASNIQNGMLPRTFPPYPDLDELALYGTLMSAKEVGGDLYDFSVRDYKAYFCVGDVSGKGVPASLVMAVTRSLFRSVSSRVEDPSQIMSQINNAMSEMNENSMFVTLFIGVLDLHTGELTYSNAGHCAPVLLGEKPIPVEMDANIPVGIMSDWKFTSQKVTLQPGQTLFTYTDGLTEAENANHEQFGEERMMEVLAQSGTTPRLLIENIIQEVHNFVGQAEQSDDLTMLAVQFTKPRAAAPSHIISNSIILHNDIQEVPLMTEFVEKTAEQANLDPSVTMTLTLAIEEAVANIMKYAYPEGEVGSIEINAIINDGSLSFTIKDSGTPFDPTQVKKADITLSAEDREIGGLGIHLIRNIMDTVEYHHTSDQNILTLTKNIE